MSLIWKCGSCGNLLEMSGYSRGNDGRIIPLENDHKCSFCNKVKWVFLANSEDRALLLKLSDLVEKMGVETRGYRHAMRFFASAIKKVKENVSREVCKGCTFKMSVGCDPCPVQKFLRTETD